MFRLDRGLGLAKVAAEAKKERINELFRKRVMVVVAR
jgi:hypothetical protein